LFQTPTAAKRETVSANYCGKTPVENFNLDNEVIYYFSNNMFTLLGVGYLDNKQLS
jgi:hypothetical protein